MSQHASMSRTGLAATAFGIPATGRELVTAVSAFRGYRAPGEGLATHLVAGTFTALDQVPLDVRLYVHDLQDTAERWPALPITLPPTPWQAATLVDDLAALVTALSATELREAAEGMALTRGEVALASDKPVLARDWRKDGPLPDPTALPQARRAREAELLQLFGHMAPHDWLPEQADAVRKALLIRLAGLGDALLRVSRSRRPLWTGRQTANGSQHACPCPAHPSPCRPGWLRKPSNRIPSSRGTIRCGAPLRRPRPASAGGGAWAGVPPAASFTPTPEVPRRARPRRGSARSRPSPPTPRRHRPCANGRATVSWCRASPTRWP
ncbi:hypothetical protein ACIBBE_24035 [Streptomyces sp. NPDC051644]|uniref:hypothetical protein n=1 Tax=Streptomyces sp. NPDC051644 TaxID=3365666 RepID=UPI0037A43C55